MKRSMFGLMPAATVLVSLMFIAMAALLQGCESMDQPEYSDPTTRALSDPWNYEPNMDSPDTNIGGHSDAFDKAGFQRDVDYVVNP